MKNAVNYRKTGALTSGIFIRIAVIVLCTTMLMSANCAGLFNIKHEADVVTDNPTPGASLMAMAGDDQPDVEEGTEVTLNAAASTVADGTTIATYLWTQNSGASVSLSNANTDTASFRAPFAVEGESLVLEFRITITNNEGDMDSDDISVTVSHSPTKVDADGNGLIEIDTLEMLHNMRHDLAGTSYKTSAGDTGLTGGCPDTGCMGYELTRSLNFDTNGDDSTWSGDATMGFTLDMADDNDTYFDVDAGGWSPIGDATTAFTATFNGNGNTISNLATQRAMAIIGFFGVIDTGAVIRNIGLVNNLADYNGTDFMSFIGGLVGQQKGGTIDNAYTTGPADGDGVEAHHENRIGALVGQQDAGTIVNSYAAGPVHGQGGVDNIGGLVGYQVDGSIIASHATGSVDGGSGMNNTIGGLVGNQFGGRVVASYATGNVRAAGPAASIGGLMGLQFGSIIASYAKGIVTGGNQNTVGGLVGKQSFVVAMGGTTLSGPIIASYATGAVSGGADDDGGGGDRVGGLVGEPTGTIVASYATGTVSGGGGTIDIGGNLIGGNADTITTSYGFGTVMADVETPNTLGTALPGVITMAIELLPANAGTEWSATAGIPIGAWDFGSTSQAPALKYADYDGTGTAYSCDMFPDPDNPAENLCGSIIPGQGR